MAVPITRSDPDPSLDDFGDRLDAKLKQRAKDDADQAARDGQTKGIGAGLRIVSDLVAGVAVGAFLGLGIDAVFGTSPWGLIVCLLFGFGGGVSNAIRSAQAIGQASENEDA
ncbi:MAG: AtpZ/AtpI family protein [Pseudomonadota bacterium]